MFTFGVSLTFLSVVNAIFARFSIFFGAYAAVIKNAFLVLLTSYIVLRLVRSRLLHVLLSSRHRGLREVIL